ncbi:MULTISPECIES: glucose 1-dehydrogenase [unclassified Rhizobium]|jgi:NAD(P)-dependent dehydrogenase (short-subunit alcohol dehydrogenase family)|uniref:SDR family NAD(P)-dependent oxidoreductase n=1 Tax=unclassified Rhizobium TaxID=2613769 RepID=UPI00064608E3|nr:MULTISPECIES: glucose 1-dehydrogenase [unclassified Rhizobium]OJY72093.1 MAG: 2-deoxy-D-gluconate 3-dehydrogenase [Rhizobium sp. 60-20]RKD36056.1 NAD(P)-dependent dehydrogenase (short-subunit alcohol dehydrogenase family) [Rhizobium sp. WW_1]
MAKSIFDLSKRVAVVTGASRGLGQWIALSLAEAGADICITSRDETSLSETKRKIESLGRSCLTSAQDVTDIASIDDTLKGFASRAGTIDILVNNAGYEEVSPSFDVDEQLWDKIIGTNLKGAFFWSQAAARKMAKQQDGGSIINLCSLTSYVGIPTAVPYGSSKSGLLGMTRALSAEWAQYGIRVNAVAPGYFRTTMTEGFYQDENWSAKMLDKIPQKRFGKETDIGGAVVFLASSASAYITGQCIPVDGGFLASI